MLFLLLASLFFHTCLHSTSAYEDPRFTLCTPTTPTYTPNSTFSATLTTALTTLQTTTAATGFATTTATNPTTNSSVTALALCRSSTSPPDCQTCVAAAALGIRRECPNNTAAQVWYTYCMLRYSPINFVNQSDTSITFSIYDTRDAPDESSYDLKVNLLIKNLSYAAGASDNRSAVGRTVLVGSLNIYGYVDCTRDIDGGDCTTCLLAAIDWIPSCCLGKWAGWIATPTCNIQFNMDPIHEDWINNPQEIDTDILSPAPEVGPAADEGGLGGGGGGGKERSVVVGVGVSFVGIVGMVGLIWWRWRGREGRMGRKGDGGTNLDTL
ncbi:cysteine-rich repeat secretory protein 38-like [Rhododendron vialii]|uniref:cysteine-rich repeat secretory protein 38-like n=1 Tax=Rhododendron vialii TaxID=182163 RepID=UPI00265D81A4|nr:cysteine-rich repeat secretory protein 38-like [Rhododendron vialii]